MFTFGRDKERLEPWIMFRYAMAVALTVCAMMLYIYPSIRATSLMYEYSMEYRRLTELKERNKTLKLKMATLRSLDNIERRAVLEMGFVYPAQGQVVIIAKK
jgi:cell division protein FtsB